MTELRFYVPLDTKTGHFGDLLPSTSFSLVLNFEICERIDRQTDRQTDTPMLIAILRTPIPRAK